MWRRGPAEGPGPRRHLRGSGARRPPYLWMQFPWQRAAAGRGPSPVPAAPLLLPRRPAPGRAPPPAAPAWPLSASPLRSPPPPGPRTTGTRSLSAAAARLGDPAAWPWLAVPPARRRRFGGAEVRCLGGRALPAAAPAWTRGLGRLRCQRRCRCCNSGRAAGCRSPRFSSSSSPSSSSRPRRGCCLRSSSYSSRRRRRRSATPKPVITQVKMACFVLVSLGPHQPPAC